MTRKRSTADPNTNGHFKLEAKDLKAISLNEEAKVEKSTRIVKAIRPATFNQKSYVNSIKRNVITICTGPSGTGKTLLALYQAVAMLNNEETPIQRIVYIRSLVHMSTFEQEVGCLPGELDSKLAPLTYPMLDNLSQFMELGRAEAMIRDGIIEVSPMSLLRGRSFSNCLVIADECQNAPLSALKTILTRIGEGSRMVLVGDDKQSDLRIENGLKEMATRLWGLPDVGVIEMDRGDIMRHSIIPHILARLEDYDL